MKTIFKYWKTWNLQSFSSLSAEIEFERSTTIKAIDKNGFFQDILLLWKFSRNWICCPSEMVYIKPGPFLHPSKVCHHVSLKLHSNQIRARGFLIILCSTGMADAEGQGLPPPDFGRSENGGGSNGASHYYPPPNIFRPSAPPVKLK